MFQRQLTSALREAAKTFPALTLTGPRQSGKTTLLKHIFPDYTYVSLEPTDIRSMAIDDPRGFLSQFTGKTIFDEVQLAPELFSFIQTIIDEQHYPGRFILSGSQNFLLLEQISQSLAGRTAIFDLLPLSYEELITHTKHGSCTLWDLLYQGLYPRPHHENLNTHMWYESYIRTYLERDVRKLLNIQNLNTFRTFMKLCAGRHGQILNLNGLSNDCGISHTTASRWISLLESSYILFRLQPHHANFNKRLIKSPKLYFYDSAIVCHLLDIESPMHLQNHAQRGAIFEGFVLCEWLKYRINRAKKPNVYFWRDQQGNEVDIVYDKAGELFACEVKSAQTFNASLLSNINRWIKITKSSKSSCHLVYGGDHDTKYKDIPISGWQTLSQLFSRIAG